MTKMSKHYSNNIQMGKMMMTEHHLQQQQQQQQQQQLQTPQQVPNGLVGSGVSAGGVTTSEDYLNRKISFIQNHINNLLIEITNLPEPWTYAVTEDGRVFFINENEQRTTWLHPKSGQPVSVMIVPPLEDLPTGWQKDYILGLPYLIDHNSKKNFLNSLLNKTADAVNKSPENKNHIRPEIQPGLNANLNLAPPQQQHQQLGSEHNTDSNNEEEPKSIIKSIHSSNYSDTNSSSMRSPSKSRDNGNYHLQQQQQSMSPSKKNGHMIISADISSSSSSLSNSNNNNSYSAQNNNHTNSSANSNNQLNVAIDSALRKYGWLYKLSHNGLKLWRKRYFVLTDYILDYYSDSSMSKHCGTIFLNNTVSRQSNKKDGSSANNRKYSFKVELMQPDQSKSNGQINAAANDLFIYLAADSTANMNEWINKFNFVSKLKDSNNTRTGFIEKRGSSSRSASNTSTKNSGGSGFIIKHDNNSGSKSKSGSNSFNRFSKSNSAPSSPNLDSSKNSKNHKSSENSTGNSGGSNVGQQPNKLRSSISTSANINRIGGEDRKKIKKKLAFSDDEILNDRPQSGSHHSGTHRHSRNLTDYETDENMNSSYNEKSRRSRASSLTKSSNGTSSSRTRNKSASGNYDYKPIYDAFERPVNEMVKALNETGTNQQQHKSMYSSQHSKNYSHFPAKGNNSKYNTISGMRGPMSDFKMDHLISTDNYMDRDKIAAAHAAANAAAKSSDIKDNSGHASSPPKQPSLALPKVINCFYNITKSQIEELPKSEVQMLIRQLRRNFVLLNQSHQRFSLIQKLFEPYELIYQHKQSQSQLPLKPDEHNMNELTQHLHDSYQTIRDRTCKIELKMDSVENSLRLANQYHESSQSSGEDNANESNGSYSSYFRLYEYQIVEMQHEYELLLEDKIIIEKLLDNQMRVFTKYENLSNEKSLIQQFNALTQEMDQLKLQLNKVNQLLNDTISEKCKQELMHSQQSFQQANTTANNATGSNFNSRSDNGNLFRASLVPVGMTQQQQHQQNLSSNPLINGTDTKSVSSIWKMSNSPGKQQQPQQVQKKQQFSSIDNLCAEDNYQQYQKYKANNYAQLETPRLRNQNNGMMSHQQYRSSMYNPNHHYYYLNGNDQSASKKKPSNLEHNISKSIDALCSSGLNNECTGSAPYAGASRELPVTFQPVNFTQKQPKVLRENFKRDSVAEKKRASIGKFPQNLNYSSIQKSSELFQPIPSHHQTQYQNYQQQNYQQQQQQSARERLFGNNTNNSNNQNYGSIPMQTSSNDHELPNSRKIAMVKPELRSSENELIQRFTQQNQMEYFDADYSEIINKNINKPEVFSIPKRQNYDIEPDVELTEEELRAKEKRMLEIKKMIALQSLQHQVDDSNSLNSTYNYGSGGKQQQQTNGSSSNYAASDSTNFEREKKAREQLVELRHELAEQIKEKSRQNAHLAALNGSNGFSTSSTTSSIPIELEHQRSNESQHELINERSPEKYNFNQSQNSFYNSTPAPPAPAAFHSIFNMNSLKSNGSYDCR